LKKLPRTGSSSKAAATGRGFGRRVVQSNTTPSVDHRHRGMFFDSDSSDRGHLQAARSDEMERA
jgi:hypothetical protein